MRRGPCVALAARGCPQKSSRSLASPARWPACLFWPSPAPPDAPPAWEAEVQVLNLNDHLPPGPLLEKPAIDTKHTAANVYGAAIVAGEVAGGRVEHLPPRVEHLSGVDQDGQGCQDGHASERMTCPPTSVVNLTRWKNTGKTAVEDRCGLGPCMSILSHESSPVLSPRRFNQPPVAAARLLRASITVWVMSMPGSTVMGTSEPGCVSFRCRLVGL